MKRDWLDIYVEIFARPRFASFHNFLLLAALRGLGILNYKTEEQSGESYFLKSILAEIDHDGSTILDVGANEGNFIESVLENSKHLKIIGVEPHPKIFARLRARFSEQADRVELLGIGAGSAETTMQLYDYSDADGSSHASVFKEVIEGVHRGVAQAREVPVRRLDTVLAERQVKLGLIKIDVEGFEFEVLKGLSQTLAEQDIKYIIIEFNEMNVVSRTFMKDFIEYLKAYRAYRILPMGRLLPLPPYHALFIEQFAYQNIVFIKNS